MEKTKKIEKINNKKSDKKNIIIYNDDINTFDWVIKTLIDICDHNYNQAEQCATIIHYKGKCDVKNGDYDELKPICLSLLQRNLSAKIE